MLNQEVEEPASLGKSTNMGQEMVTKYGPRSEQHNLRSRKPRGYSYLHIMLESIVMAQHSVKKGLQIFGDYGVQAVMSKLKQLHNREVMDPKGVHFMAAQQGWDALRYLTFLKQKHCGKIRGHIFADGRKHHEYP
jgi:hypothetical protein